MQIDKRDWFVTLLFLVLVLVFFSRFLTGDQVFAFKDLSRYFYPLRYLMVEQVKSGHLPLWNPYIFCGMPLLATLQIGFFYPLSIIYYILPFNLAFNYYIILHYFLAACFMFFLLRHYKLSRAASFLGGIIFAFSGYLLSVSNMNTSLSSVIWLPLVLLAWDKVVSPHPSTLKTRTLSQGERVIPSPFGRGRGVLRRRVRAVLLLAVLLALMFLGGEPTIIYVTLFFLVAYAGIFSGSWRLFFKNVGSLILAGVIALGLVAVQLLPFLELARLSDRVVRTAYELVTLRSFPPRELLTFIFPYFFGNPAEFGGYTETLLGKTIQDWLISPYLGILPLIFIFLSFRKKRSLSLFFAGTTVVSLFLSFGKYTPLYRVVYLLPGISMIRYPVKYLFLATFCLAILASFGFEELLEIFDAQKKRLLKIFKMVSSLSGILLLGLIFGYLFRLQIFEFLAKKYSAGIPSVFLDILAGIVEFNLISLFNVILYFSVFALLLWAAYRGRIKKIVFSALLILLIGADLFANGASIGISASSEVFSRVPENYRILQEEKGLYRFFYTPELEKENRVIYGENYNAALLWAKDNFAANWHIPYHFYDFHGYESVKPYGLFNFYRQRFGRGEIGKNLKFLSFFNVKYIASIEKLDVPYLRLLRHKKKYGLDLYLYENKKVFPRAYILGRQNKPDLLMSRAEIVKYLPDEVVILARPRENGHLFLSDAFYPGWRVFVDGKESKINPADDFFRGVELTKGEHEVKFVYDPLSFKIGAIISSLTILGLAFIGLIIRKGKK